MLIKQPRAANDVITIKLMTGEELIAYWMAEDLTTVTVRKPFVLVQDNQGGVGLMPFMTSSVASDGEKIEIKHHAIVSIANTTTGNATAFAQQVSGLTI